MHEVIYEQTARIEERMWWHVSHRDLARLFLSRARLPEDAVALDVGCGTGGALEMLSECAARVVGLDKSPRAVELARRKHPAADIRLGDANALGDVFQPETFDLVTFLGVLYHEWITDDAAVLRQAWQLLKPGGVILATDPAFGCLARNLDRLMCGQRRYTLPRVRSLLEQAGFEHVSGTYFNAVAFPPALLLATWERRHPNGDTKRAPRELAIPPRPVNEMFKLIAACERTAIRILGRLPFGVNVLSLARKPRRA